MEPRGSLELRFLDTKTLIDARVRSIDLERLKRKLQEERGWTQDTLNAMERQYRQFLTLKLRFPEHELVPTRFIDEMWHAHILDTRSYARDCELVFGYFLHHYPYLGVGGEGAKQQLDDAFVATVALWAEGFGEDYRSLPSGSREHVDAGAASRCQGHACHAPSSCACRTPGACKDECERAA